jgi:hypothetical protein
VGAKTNIVLNMKIFKTKTSLSATEFIVLQLCIASFYLMAGSYFHGFFGSYYTPLFSIFGVSAIWFVYWQVDKMKKQGI